MNKLEEWFNLTDDEKRKYNGYKGFIEGNRFADDNAFKRRRRKRNI